MLFCAEDAQGRYLPYGKNSVMPIRGGLEQIWRGFPQAVPDFGAEIVEMIKPKRTPSWCRHWSAGYASGRPRPCKEGEVGRIAQHIIRFNTGGKISRLDCYWDNTAINTIKASAL